VPASLTQTTLDEVGKPDDQFVALAFQSVVPVTGPCQLSVHVGWLAPLGVAVASTTAPADPIDAAAITTAMKILRNPTMVICSVSGSVCRPYPPATTGTNHAGAWQVLPRTSKPTDIVCANATSMICRTHCHLSLVLHA